MHSVAGFLMPASCVTGDLIQHGFRKRRQLPEAIFKLSLADHRRTAGDLGPRRGCPYAIRAPPSEAAAAIEIDRRPLVENTIDRLVFVAHRQPRMRKVNTLIARWVR